MRRILLEFVLPVFFLLSIYLGVAFFLSPAQVIWSPDEGAKLLQLRSIRLEDSALMTNIPYQGFQYDPDFDYFPQNALLKVQDDQLLFRRLPIFTLLSKPFFSLFGSHGLYIIPAFFGALISIMTVYLVPSNERHPLMWVLLAFASPVLIYATLFWEHTLSSGLVLIGGLLLLNYYCVNPQDVNVRKISGLILIGALFALSAYLRLETIIFVFAIIVAYLLVVRHWGILIVGTVFVLLMIPYSPLHGMLFGQQIPDNASYLFQPFVYLSKVGSGWQAIKDLLIGPISADSIDTAWLGDIWIIAAALVISRSFDAEKIPLTNKIKLWALIVSVVIAALFLFTTTEYRAAHGLLFTTPWVLLGISRSREVWTNGSTQAKIITLTVIVGLVGYSIGILFLRGAFPHGGLEWGSRFFMTFFPLIAVLAGWRLTSKQKNNILILVTIGGMLFLGFGFQIRGLITIRQDKQIVEQLGQELREAIATDNVIVTDLWWLSFNVPALFLSTPIYVTELPEDTVDWLDMAQRKEIENFVMVTLDKQWPINMADVTNEFDFVIDQAIEIGNLSLFYFSS